MLADDVKRQGVGTLDSDCVPFAFSLSSVVGFVCSILPHWRDDPKRNSSEKAEDKLTEQLCARLNSASRHASGFDCLQFRREEQVEENRSRKYDLVAAPCGVLLWIDGRTYDDYEPILPIECKRLPTPSSKDRDHREYLLGNAGGVQRFKDGHHGPKHAHAAMIGYLQSEGIAYWCKMLDNWIDSAVNAATVNWSAADKLQLVKHDSDQRVATLKSKHSRANGLVPIRIDHLWIEMKRHEVFGVRFPSSCTQPSTS